MATKSLRALSFNNSRRTTSPGPPSPTFSDATNVSTMQFGVNGPTKIITRSNLKASVQAYEDLLNTCGAYRTALLTMSKATAAFADTMQRCSGLKGPNYESGTRLQAASGVHHLMGNLWHVLAESLDKGFEKPLRQHLETYKLAVHERSQDYERVLHEKSQIIRDTETKSMNRKERNLQTFREALSVLQRQVDELDELKLTHYQNIVEHEEEVWDVVQGKICLLLRSTMDIFDRFTSKASDPVIEPMLQSVPDPFDAYGPPQAEDQIFSILSPLSISMNMNSTTDTTPTKGLSASSSLADLSSSATMVPPIGGITPERDYVDRKISSWLPGANGAMVRRSKPMEWVPDPRRAKLPPSPSRVSPVSPLPSRYSASSSSLHRPGSISPRTRKYSEPTPTIRKAETQLRSVLAVLEEDKLRIQPHSNITSNGHHPQHNPSIQNYDESHPTPPPPSSVLNDADVSSTGSCRPDLLLGNAQTNRNGFSDDDPIQPPANDNALSGMVDGGHETPRTTQALPPSSLLFPSGPDLSHTSTAMNGSPTRTPTATPHLVLRMNTDLGDALAADGWSDEKDGQVDVDRFS